MADVTISILHNSSHSSSALADDRLSVVAGHVVELDPIIVEVVEHGQA